MLHPVSDLATAKEVSAALLGGPPRIDDSYYVSGCCLAATITDPDGNGLDLLQVR